MAKLPRKRRPVCREFFAALECGERPDTFEEAYGAIPPKVCGFYECEARAIWNVLRAEDARQPIVRLGEVGRNLGGGLYLLACALPSLRFVRSVDILAYDEVDDALHAWLSGHGIAARLEEADSRTVRCPPITYDLVYIDGEHTGDGVRADIENWQDHTRLIAFHDFADRGRRNHHRRTFPDVVAEIQLAAQVGGWQQVGKRGRSEIVYRVR